MEQSNNTVLKLEDVRKVFFPNSPDETQALNGVDLEVYAQDFISVIGSNGAGKSTTLNIIAGVYPPEKGGAVMINGEDVTSLPEYKHAHYVGRVWQEPHVGTAGNLSIEENLSLATMRDTAKSLKFALSGSRRRQFRDILATLDLGLEDRLHALVGTLSGGQRQALSLVMATISKPAILLLDEHIAKLDPRTAETVMQMTGKIIRQEKMTAMMVTHNMEIALQYGNRLVMMHKGRVVVDIHGEDKKALSVPDLISAFEQACGEKLDDDKVLLSGIKGM
jgi:putative ABC transport system ATP-binding protein